MKFPSRFASLDIGSNTVRLLLAERTGEKTFRPIRMERKVTRLGGNFSLTGYLHPESIARTIEALRDFAAILKREQAAETFAVSTGVVREARNGDRFLEMIQKETGILPRLLRGEEEARLMLKGVLWGVPKGIPVHMVVDIGGWSTEIIWIQDTNIRKTVSTSLGAVSLCENFLKSDSPKTSEIESLEQYLKDSIQKFFHEFPDEGWRNPAPSPLVGTAGTITTLAAIDLKLNFYDPEKVTGHQISAERLRQIFAFLSPLTKDQKRLIPGLEKGREDLILSGTKLLMQLMEFFGFENLLIVDSGLLEGILLDRLFPPGSPSKK